MAYGDKIQELFQLPVDYQDERLTTSKQSVSWWSKQMLQEPKEKVIDKLAAVMILKLFRCT